ncbi:Hsp70 family protein [Dactylosporangium sp. CA-139066]|uniref:Hsp70 family protein n=1 Tax=Dactylosporangium sp. CA-139066 TaxID=3239930 RepID=UPI003D8D4E0D
MGGYHLGIDFGTARTAAVLARPDGRREQLLLEPSAVCLDNAPHFAAGHDAIEAGAASPDRFEPYPRRSIDRGAVVLGGVECPVRSLFAAVLTHVAAASRRVVGGPLASVALTHPAAWHRPHTTVLEKAANLVGLRPARLVAEPVAAALHADETGRLPLPEGASAVVVDVGAGSFDAAVVARTGRTVSLIASTTVPEAGGLALDASILAYLGSAFARRTVGQWRPDQALLDGARAGREELTAAKASTIPVPWSASGMTLTRTQFEALARPPLQRAMQSLASLVAGAGVGDLAGLLLTGGVADTPLVTEMLVETLGLLPVHLEGPILAEGALLAEPSAVPRRPRRPEAPAVPTGPRVDPNDLWAALQQQPGAQSPAAPSPQFQARSAWPSSEDPWAALQREATRAQAHAPAPAAPPAAARPAAARPAPRDARTTALRQTPVAPPMAAAAPTAPAPAAPPPVAPAPVVAAAQPRPVQLEPWEIRAELWVLEQDKPWRFEQELLKIRAECRAAQSEYRAVKADLVSAAQEVIQLRSEMDLASTDLHAAAVGLRAAGAELDEFEAELDLMVTKFRTRREPPPDAVTPEPATIPHEPEPNQAVAEPDVLATLRAITEPEPEPQPEPESEPEPQVVVERESAGEVEDFGAVVRVVRRYMQSARRGAVAEKEPLHERDGWDADAELPLSDVAVSPSPLFPAPKLTLADRSRPASARERVRRWREARARRRPEPSGPRGHRRQRMRPGVSAAITLVVALVALGGGTLAALKLTGSMPDHDFQVGECVAQQADRATVVDCDARGAFEITEQVPRSERCPDRNQPFVIKGEALYCLVPVRSRP